MRSAPDGTFVAAFLAAMFAMILLLAAPAAAQQAGEQATTQTAEEATTAAKEQAPTGEDPENPATAAKQDDETADAQDASEETENAQESGQQAGSAEDEGRQTEARAVGPLANATATLIDEDDTGNTIERITIAADDCNPPRAANSSVTIGMAGESGDAIISDAENAFEYEDDQIVIGPEDDGEAIVARGENPLKTAVSTGTVVDSSGIACSRADEGAEDRDDIDDLNCDEVLQRFRNAGSQYGDAAFFAGDDVQDRVIVCLEREVDDDTAADEDLPDTGGPSLIGLAALGVVSALAGFSLVRGSRRKD